MPYIETKGEHIVTLELRDGFKVYVSAELPMTPDSLASLAQIVQRMKDALRHYRAETQEGGEGA